ncbi:MAG: ATP-binding protein, partial [Methanococcaceae archaeon]
KEPTLLNDICSVICNEAGYKMAWVGFAEHNEDMNVRPVAWAGNNNGYLLDANITWADTERGRGSTGKAVRNGKTYCIQDFATDPDTIPWREKALQNGYHSCISLPLKDEKSVTFGVLVLYSPEANAFNEEEIRLLEELAGNLAFGINVLRSRDERRLAEEALNESNKQMERIIEGSNNLYWERDLIKGEMVITGNAPELLPFNVKEKRPGVYDFNELVNNVHPDDKEMYFREARAIIEKNKPVYDVEYRKISRSGELIWVHTKGKVVEWDKEGNPLKISGTQSNITEKKNAEDEILTINNKLKELNATKDKLLSILAHDLRGPFQGFMGLTEELAVNIDAMEKRDIAEYATALNDTAKKIFGLLNNLLEWSRVQTGKMEFKPVRLNLHDEVELIINLFSAAARSKEIEIIVDVSPEAFVFADHTMLSAVLRNLLSNALKFTNCKGKVTLCSKEVNDFIEVCVCDTGIGMNEEIIGKIFRIDSIYTTPGTNGEEGTGFGLVLCKEMVEKNGGKIQAQSTQGSGTKFLFSLPLSDKNELVHSGV